MARPGRSINTVIAAFRNKRDQKHIEKVLSNGNIRVIGVGDVISLIDSLDQHRVNVVISEYTLGGVSALSFIPFIRKRYPGIKVIVVMRRYSPAKEIELRQKNVMYVMSWPVSTDIEKP